MAQRAARGDSRILIELVHGVVAGVAGVRCDFAHLVCTPQALPNRGRVIDRDDSEMKIHECIWIQITHNRRLSAVKDQVPSV